MTEQSRSNRLVLLTIIGLPVTMFLTATWLWYYVASGHLDLVGALGTANQGTLVEPPRPLHEAQLLAADGPKPYAGLPVKWTMLVVNPGAECGEACEAKLYVTRQIHLALGKYFDRVDRIYLSDAGLSETELAVDALSDQSPLPDSFASYMEQQHRDLLPLTLASGELGALVPELREDPSTWYLVDPAGWVMMSYNSSISYKDVISDLKFLLKNSSE